MKTRLTAFLFLLLCMAVYSTESICIDFTQSKSVQIGDVDYVAECKSDADGLILIGSQGFSFPAASLTGDDCGTILVNCRFSEIDDTLNVMRNLLNLRTKSRYFASFYYFADGSLSFGATDNDKRYSCRITDKIEPGRNYLLGFTWDGTKICVYLDGMAIGENEQPLPFTNISNINIGPYKDGWYNVTPWNDDAAIKDIRVFNEALSPVQIAELCNVTFKPITQTHPMKITVPPVPSNMSAPTVDGKLDDSAWQYAACIPRLIRGNFPMLSGAMPPHSFKLIYDNDNLYVSSRTHFPAHVPFIEGDARTPEKEPEVWGSESIEFYIKTDHVFRFAGNLAGGYCESCDFDSNWNGSWKFLQNRAMLIDDSIVWDVEMTIPWKTIGLDVPPTEDLLINCCHSWKLPEIGQHSSLNLSGQGYNQDAMIPVSFRPCPVLQIEKHNNPNEGDYEQEFTITSPKTCNVSYELSVARLDGSSLPISIYKRNWNLKADESRTDKHSSSITFADYDCLIYSFHEGNELVMREIIPYKLDDRFFNVEPRFMSGKICVKMKAAIVKSKLGANFRGKAILADANAQVLSSVEVSINGADLEFNRDWGKGDYTVSLQDQNGKKIAEQTVFYPGHEDWEQMEFPEDIIIPPFTPMITEQSENGFVSSLALRKYGWNNTMLPTSINSLDEELLAASISLLLGNDALKCTEFQVKNTKPHRVEFSAKGQNANGSADISAWLEYDGVQWNEVALTAADNKPAFAIQLTLPSRFAKYLHAASSSGWGAKTTMAVPNGKSVISYYPVFWIGNEEKGLCFFAESHANWTHSSRNTYLVDKNDDVTTVTIFISDSMQAGKTDNFGFGFLATPIRPFASNYPFDTLGWSYASPLNRDDAIPVSDLAILNPPAGTEQGDLGSYFADTNDADGNARINAYRICFEQQTNGHHVRPIPYLCGRYISSKYPEMLAYKADWSFTPEQAMDYSNTGHFVYDCCPASSASAFFAWKVKNLLTTFPEMKGLYFDFGNVPECSNEAHGCHGRLPILAQREFYRRMALVQLQAGIESPVIVLHNTDSNMLPTYTFATHLLNGEHVRQASSTLLHNKKDILDSYNLEMFACELSSLPFGITNSVYMPLDTLIAKYGGDEKTAPYQFRLGKAEHAATLVHNTVICLWRNHYGIMDKFLRVFDRFGVGRPGSHFVGYWHNPAEVTGADDIYVSCHVNGNKVLAVIGHLGKPHVNQSFSVKFDWNVLGVTTPPTSAVDTMNADDPAYQELFERQKKYNVPPFRAPLELGDFGSKLISFEGDTLQMSLDYHCFAIIELK